MVEMYPALPGFTGNLSEFLGDLRSCLFPTQAAAARDPHFPVQRPTLNKYENGSRQPDIGYLAYLGLMIAQKGETAVSSPTPSTTHLLHEINKAIRACYPAQPPFHSWAELETIALRYRANHQLSRKNASSAPPTQAIPPPQRRDWGEAPDTTHFFGRERELTWLETWLRQPQTRLIGIFGMGKTRLTTRAARDLAAQFSHVLWRSIGNAPAIEDLLAECLHFFCDPTDPPAPTRLDQQLPRLLTFFRQHRCLLVLDNYENVL
jgi:hypothetical protein